MSKIREVFEKGEGIEKKKEDFAAEIASMVGGK